MPLYSKAFDLLLELLDSVWPGQVLEEANLTVSMSVVRKALGEKAMRPLQLDLKSREAATENA